MRLGTLATVAVAAALLAACAPATEAPDVLFFGDSYTEGTGLADPSERWTSQVSAELGWQEVNAGCPGSGFTSPALRCGTFLDRLPQLASLDPRIVIVAGGLNDAAASTDDVRAAITATLESVRAQWPGAEVWVVSAVGFEGFAALEAINAHLESESARLGMRWVDLGQPLLAGGDVLLGDRIHPNERGHVLIAEAFITAVGQRIQP